MRRCKLKNCPFDRDGKCVENQLPNCPNLISDEAAADVTLADPIKQEREQQSQAPTHESVYSGKKMTAQEAALIFQSNPVVIVLGGMVETGKTTLLARIFEM